MTSPTVPPARDWSLDYAAVGLEMPPATADELEEDAAFATASGPVLQVDPVDAAALSYSDVHPWEFNDRERAIYEAGFFAGHLSRQHEVDTIENAFKQANDDADRYYRAAFDHDYHDCAIHENRGRYRGAATRYVDDAWS